MGTVAVAEGVNGCMATAAALEEDDLDSGLGLMSLEDSPELDANVSQQKDITHLNPRPKFTRAWSFVEPAQERKVSLADVKTRKSNMQIDVKRALARSWSFTKTIRSPSPAQPKSTFMEYITIDEEKMTVPTVEKVFKEEATSPMVSIGEDEELVEEEAVEEAKPVEEEMKVKLLSKSLVVPATQLETKWLPLSNLDRVVNPTFSSVIHYYERVVTNTRTFSDVTKFLKETLAKVLVDFYPLAGRLTLRDDGKVDLHCNNAGAVWIEAEVKSELKDVGGAKPNHLLSGLDAARLGPGPLYIPDQLTPMPALVIQATRFNCGTVAIATSWHHTVADGFSGTHFMRSWAEVAQGKPISLVPEHDRDMFLRARDPPNPTLVTGYSTRRIEDICPEIAKVSTAAPAQLEKFELDKAAIATLKTRANLQPPPFTPRPYSSAESISAHLWMQMTKARATANSYEAENARLQPTKFFMFVDGRKRLRLPGGFFGNVVCSACAEAKEGDILTQPLHYAASLIRIATRNVTEEYFRSLIDWVELQGMSSSKSEHVNSLGHDVAATFWTFFPLYDIEFGWGRPVFAARNSPPRPLIDGIAMMPSAKGQGGMVALLNLHSDRMSKLQRQISFATVFH